VKHASVGIVIAVANQKGGVGKTTSCINLAASIAALDRRALIIDLDPQGNASTGLGVDKREVRQGSYDLLLGEAALQQVVRPTAFEGLFLVPATIDLAGADLELADHARRESALMQALQRYEGAPFDVVFIDCPPALNLLTINALVAADRVLITLQAEFFAMEGLAQLMETIRHVRARWNPSLAIDGILLTMVDRRNRICLQVEEEVRQYFGAQVYQTVIPRNVRLSEAPSHGLPVLHYDLRASGAQAYLQAAEEMLQRIQGERR